MELRQRDGLRELALDVAEQREHRLGWQGGPGGRLDLAEVRVAAPREVPDPRGLRRGALGCEALPLAGLLERFARPPQVAERLRGPEQRSDEPGVVMRAAQRGNRVSVMGERAFVVT